MCVCAYCMCVCVTRSRKEGSEREREGGREKEAVQGGVEGLEGGGGVVFEADGAEGRRLMQQRAGE